jgi:DNA recombination protein RmuC
MRKTYEEAHKKLKSGHGNLIRKTEDLKKLGVKTEKSLSSKYQPDEELEEES